MPESSDTHLPKLRAVNAQPVVQAGRRGLMLRDPLQLTERCVVVPQRLAPLLALCDGSRDAGALRASLIVRYGVDMRLELIERFLAALDEAFLLDNERFRAAQDQVLAEYREAPFRDPASAARSYPADAGELRAMLQHYLDDVEDAAPAPIEARGLVSPHIDYPRGGAVYAQVWERAREMVRSADLVVLLGTDHLGGPGRLTLTRQHYATPFGTLPTAVDVVDTLAQAIGPEHAYAEELHHRTEHSIELAAVWLQYLRNGRPCEAVPILCGSFSHFVTGEAEPAKDRAIGALLNALQEATTSRRMIVVAAADLSHMGPAFGGRPLDFTGRARLKTVDEEIIAHMCAGDAEGFFQVLKRTGDRSNVCGLPPIYVALRALAPTRGECVAYDRCPADEAGASLVSICGVILD